MKKFFIFITLFASCLAYAAEDLVTEYFEAPILSMNDIVGKGGNKTIVMNYYNFVEDKNIKAIEDIIHYDFKEYLHKKGGFKSEDKKQLIEELKKELAEYHEIKYEFSHVIADGDNIACRYTVFVKKIEGAPKEALRHDIAIWKIKNKRLYRLHEVTVLADTSSQSLDSFSKER